jgi:hypothetical protein
MRQIRFPGESPEYRRARALRERVDDLRGARQRMVAAADAERRRIERDLHDGAQQRMVAVAVTLGLAESQLGTDPPSAARLIAQAREEPQLAVKELREPARGIHPAVLSDRGLGAAPEALAARAFPPEEVSGVPSAPLRPAVEAADDASRASAAPVASINHVFLRLWQPATERTGGRCLATSNQLAPASPEPKTAPDVAPK